MSIVFSLIVPVYNVEKYIEKCLRSCLDQRGFKKSNYEVILVNDETPDKSIEVAKRVLNEYPEHNVQIVDRRNGGLSAARNTGLNHAKGKYVWFIDSDDWISNESLSFLSEKLVQNPLCDVLTFTHHTVFEDGSISNETQQHDFVKTGFEFLSKTSFLSACTCIYSLELIKNSNLFFKEGILWEDSEFNLKAYGIGTVYLFYSKPLYYYLRRSNSITTKGVSFRMIDSWFIKIDSVYDFYKIRNIEKWQRQVIYRHLALTVIAAVSGFNELPAGDRKLFRNRLLGKRKYYKSFFTNAGELKMYLLGLLVIYALPVSELLFAFLTARAVKRGEGKIKTT